jgi:glycosyltransferase involved in cell wall biosynthesis
VGGVSEALEDCGLVVEPRNPADMARACLELIQDPERTRELGRQAREKALSQFSLQQCNTGYLTTYQRLVTEIRYRHPELDFVNETTQAGKEDAYL